ncbi:MAG: hypothetical protein PWQ60_1701 [Thermoanaerobacteraceae bacterium]|jgi:superfamily II DNA or RNA helicase/HKD family nuclease|nr:hypothetical protein [Thermoanaerobacteraceae bacterium]
MDLKEIKLIHENLKEVTIEDVEKIYRNLENIYNQLLMKQNIDIQKCFCGGNENFLLELKKSFSKAAKINLIVSFLLESGVRLIIEDLIEAKKRNCPIRIITGRYLNITQPSALYLIKDRLGDYVDLRFFKDDNIPFHPKAYIFEYSDGRGDIFIGSSNISESALTYGIEWNYRIEKTTNSTDFEVFKKEFLKLFEFYTEKIDDKLLKKYSQSWKKPKVFIDIEKRVLIPQGKEEISCLFGKTSVDYEISRVAESSLGYKTSFETKIVPFLRPNDPQIEALYWLKKSREEGFEKALIVAATGIGKTLIAAFDSMEYKTILFIANREEILNQALLSFKTLSPNSTIGYFNGDVKDTKKDIILASVQTLGKEEYLNTNYFTPDYFEYIVIDEFHHAVAKSYRNIINYFKPKFLLGLTATPERLDNKDVFELCDYNVVYELRLKDAINKGYLVPFHYYGIYDETDFSVIPEVNGKYKEDELEKALMIHKRAELILKNYLKFNKQKTLAFCSSRNHAEFMAEYFNQKGIKCCAVYSGEQGKNAVERDEAIRKLKNGEIKVIFTVDMFNEGVDIPEIDMVMFLRPTESPTVFLQQLGRGLRKAKDKDYLTVLDFIGNYKRAFIVPFLLSGRDYDVESVKREKYTIDDFDFPDDCIIDFDFRLIDIFRKQSESLKDIKTLVFEEYLRIKEKLGKRPSRLELFEHIDESVYRGLRRFSDPSVNIFKDDSSVKTPFSPENF